MHKLKVGAGLKAALLQGVNMDTGFKNPIEPKKGKQKASPWNFNQPSYDERTSCYVDAGSHYGIGHKQSVGHHGEPIERVPCLPFGRHTTLEVDEIPRKRLPIDVEE